jgi:hypothetical protein
MRSVIKQAVKLDKTISDENSLNEILAVDLSSGFIWGELSDQVERWIERINEHGITKWILYLSALEEGDELDIGRIQKALIEKEGQLVAAEKIRQVLIKLSRGDLLEYYSFGNWFRKVQDPILLEFLIVWGKIEVERLDGGFVRDELRNKYEHLKRQYSELSGYMAEIYLAQILINAQQQTVPGHYFNSADDIDMPRFTFVRLRSKLGPGAGTEIDVHGAAGIEQWVVESRWVHDRKMGIKEVHRLFDKAKMIQKDRNADLVRVWFFSYDGFTQEALTFMQENQIFWSTQKELNELLDYVHLRRLPKLES